LRGGDDDYSMAVIAEFRVPAETFLLADALAATPEMHVEVRRVVADGDEEVTPYFWAWGGDFDAFEAGLTDDETVSDVGTLEASEDDERVYRVSWRYEGHGEGVVYAITDAGATILDATASGTEWELRLLFPDDDALSSFHEFCDDRGLSFDVTQLFHPHDPEDLGQIDVTPDQREALLAAHDAGYFAVPREVTLADVADDLGISESAASARLRRGHANLVRSTLATGEHGASKEV
jgi:predicted DNA binding protein